MLRLLTNHRFLLLLLIVGVCPGCAWWEHMQLSGAERAERDRLVAQREAAAVEHDVYRSISGWKKSTHRHDELLKRATPENTSVEISLEEQRGLLLVEGAIAMDFPVATGKSSHPTPKGHYQIIEKKKDYSSNLYGKIFDADGNVVVSDADTRRDVPPEGGSFVGARMPYWMRLTNGGVGMHVGYVPGRPASHGCIRLKRSTARDLFELTRIGTPVVIGDHAPSLQTGAPQ